MTQESTHNPQGEIFRHPKKVFVEIGFGLDPAFLTSTATDEARVDHFSDATYIGFDTETGSVNSAKSSTKYNDTDHLLSIGLNQGSLDGFEIPDASVDEVYIANVFAGSQAEQDARTFGLLSMRRMERYSASQNPEEKLNLLKLLYPAFTGAIDKPLSELLANMADVKRILKPEGQLTIVETNTPMDPEMLLLLLDDLGFEIEEVIEQGTEDWANLERRFHIQEGWVMDIEPYAIIARPKA